MPQVRVAVDLVHQDMKEDFASPSHPLLLSVRSGAAASMPGMMDTVLNLVRNVERRGEGRGEQGEKGGEGGAERREGTALIPIPAHLS